MIAALDLAARKMLYRIGERKRWQEFMSFLKLIRERWPGQKLYVITDSFSPHKHPKATRWAAASDVELVFLPTYASWLNWSPSSPPCAPSRSTAPITAPTPSKARQSAGAWAGATHTPSPRATSPVTQ